MIKLPEYKELTEHKAIKKARLPQKVYLPLLQHFGKPCDEILVTVGDMVKTGQMIATSNKGLFSPIHASISGKISSITDYIHPLLGKAKTVIIESDDKDEKAYDINIKDKSIVEAMAKDEIINAIFNAGIVGLGGAGFPTHVKLNPPKPIDTFILNGAECEPYLNTDFRLMVERTNEIISGADIVIKLLEPKEVYVAIEDNKTEAVEKFKSIMPANWKIKVLETEYPQGGEKQIIKSCLNKEVPQGKIPFDIGVVVHNVGTLYAIFEAIYRNKPLYEKVVTVAGVYLENSSNLDVRLGTPIKDLIDECGPVKEESKKIIMGGPMMGVTQYDLGAPVVKGTSGIIFLGKDEVKEAGEEFCLRCGECIAHCPMGLMPSMIYLAIARDRLDLAESYGVMDCIECGLCSYVCPANRNLVQAIKYAKQRIKDKGQSAKK